MLKNYVDGEPTAKIAISHNRSIETVAESFRSALWHLEKFKNPQYSQYVDRSIKQFEKMINS